MSRLAAKGAASKDAAGAAAASVPFPFPPLSILRNLRLLELLFFFIFTVYIYIYIYICIYSRFERRSVSGRRCGPVDERYHPVMVYLNQPSGSLLRVDGKKERKKEKEEKNLVRPASLVWYGDTDRLIDARGSATVLPSLKYRSHTVALIETRVEIDTLRMATILLQRSLPV